MWAWLESNKNQLELIVSAVGAILTFAGLLFAASQISENARQLEAATLYEIQKDARELFTEVASDSNYYEYVTKYDPSRTYDPAMVDAARRRIGTVLQFYSSIYNQRRLNAMKVASWQVARDDLCAFVNREPILTAWKNGFSKQAFSAQFKAEVSSCLAP